jgi:hypothetical protein
MYAGIDPGISGAVGYIHADGSFAAVHDMPTLVQTTGRRLIDAAGAFSFGHTFGSILAVLAILGIAHDVVQPASWKRRAGIPSGAPKAASIATALRLLPDAARTLARKKDDGRAEALLLALQAWELRA